MRMPMALSTTFPLRRIALLLLAAALPVAADTVTLRPVADTTLFENDPNNNLGGNASLASGTTAQGRESRALIRFNPSAGIPAGSTVNSVTVSIRVVKTPSGGVPSTFNLHRVLQNWAEGSRAGNRGGPAANGDATWNARSFPSVPWGAPGGLAGVDYAVTPSAGRLMTGLGVFTYASTAMLVADVQAWVDNPADNFGWILISDAEGVPRSAKRFGNREVTSTAPTIAVDFTPPPMATAPEITVPPQAQTVAEGAQVTFSVTATGTEPLSYQWFKGTDAVSGATNATLVLSPAAATDAGAYSVRVSNAAGAVTSAPAQLVVRIVDPDTMPRITSIQLVNGSISIRFNAKAGNAYRLEFADALLPASWNTLTNLSDVIETFEASVTDPVTSGNRFYRLNVSLAQP